MTELFGDCIDDLISITDENKEGQKSDRNNSAGPVCLVVVVVLVHLLNHPMYVLNTSTTAKQPNTVRTITRELVLRSSLHVNGSLFSNLTGGSCSSSSISTDFLFAFL